MKRALPVLLSLCAILVGLLLPRLWTQAQDGRTQVQDEAAGLLQVDLSDSSGLTLVEKMNLLADSEHSVMDVGTAPNQTALSLSARCQEMVEVLFEIIDAETARQESQTALLVSRDDRAFLIWSVSFTDAAGNQLGLYIDDETGECLGLYNRSAGGVSPDDTEALAFMCAITIGWMLEMDPMLTDDYAAWVEDRIAAYNARVDWAASGSGEAEPPDYGEDYAGDDGVFSLTDGDQVCTLDIAYGEGWFRIDAPQ